MSYFASTFGWLFTHKAVLNHENARYVGAWRADSSIIASVFGLCSKEKKLLFCIYFSPHIYAQSVHIPQKRSIRVRMPRRFIDNSQRFWTRSSPRKAKSHWTNRNFSSHIYAQSVHIPQKRSIRVRKARRFIDNSQRFWTRSSPRKAKSHWINRNY